MTTEELVVLLACHFAMWHGWDGHSWTAPNHSSSRTTKQRMPETIWANVALPVATRGVAG
jgi:hypothetical protein